MIPQVLARPEPFVLAQVLLANMIVAITKLPIQLLAARMAGIYYNLSG